MSSRPAEQPDFGILLHLAFAAFKEDLHRQLAKDGFDDLGNSFGFVFRALDAAPLSLRELAGRLGISPQGALKIVDEMVAKDYVLRQADPEDRRITRLTLAPRGRKAIAAAKRCHRRCEARLAEKLGQRRVTDTRAVLAEIAAAAGEAGVVRPF